MGGLIKASYNCLGCWVTCIMKVTHSQLWCEEDVVFDGYEVSKNSSMFKWLCLVKEGVCQVTSMSTMWGITIQT